MSLLVHDGMNSLLAEGVPPLLLVVLLHFWHLVFNYTPALTTNICYRITQCHAMKAYCSLNSMPFRVIFCTAFSETPEVFLILRKRSRIVTDLALHRRRIEYVMSRQNMSGFEASCYLHPPLPPLDTRLTQLSDWSGCIVEWPRLVGCAHQGSHTPSRHAPRACIYRRHFEHEFHPILKSRTAWAAEHVNKCAWQDVGGYLASGVISAMSTKQPTMEQQPEATVEQEGAEGGSPSDMVVWFESAITNYEATFVVFYRGYWWSYCKVRNQRLMP